MAFPIWILVAVGIFIVIVLLFRWMNRIYIMTLVKDNMFYFFMIALLLFLSFSFYSIHKNYGISLMSMEGVSQAGKIYFVWLKSVFSNLGKVTGYAIHQDWFLNSTSGS